MAKFFIVSGPPGSGKTSFAKKLQSELGIPLFCKDELKCLLAGNIPGEGLKWTQTLGLASINILKLIIDNFANSSGACIVESAFMPRYDNEYFMKIKNSGSEIIQFYCEASNEITLQRFKQRVEANARHSCHQDHLRYQELEEKIKGGVYGPIKIDETFILDTSTVDSYPEAINHAKKILKNSSF